MGEILRCLGDDESVRESEILQVLHQVGAADDRLVHLEQWPAQPGVTAEWPAWADAQVVAGYRRRGVTLPWQHQVAAADRLWSGGHAVVATPTGSGKSLAAWLPALSAVRAANTAARGRAGRRISQYAAPPTALYLSPTKALAADQLAGLQALLAAGEITDVRVATCDGDTPTDERAWVRDHAHIVLTNPDFLHYSLLPGHRRWSTLLRGLRFVILDEAHAYRGIMGAHVALVVRRLLRLAEQLGARPAVLLASATTGAPAASAARLLGVTAADVLAVTASTAPQGRRTLALWQPARLAAAPVEDDEWYVRPDPQGDTAAEPEPVLRRSALTEAADLLVALARERLRTLVFVRSRMAAEIVADVARQRLAAEGVAAPVAAYRGGYLPEERRELERSLRTGELVALVTTNALELGVDIAGLDAVLIAGWPGTRVSLWQQAGRAGRAGSAGVAVLIASDDPLDSYVVHHPEAIVGQDVEATAFDPANPYVLAPHLCAAAAEAPLTEADFPRFGLDDDALLQELTARGLLRRRPTGWFWNFTHPTPPASLTDLRGGAGRPVQVVEHATGAVVGTVDGQRADAQVHPGAVYVHQGRHFVVNTLTDDVALVEPADPPTFRTRAYSQATVRVLHEAAHQTWPAPGGEAITWSLGTVDVTSRVHSFARLRLPGLELEGTYPLDMPERVLTTTAVWWSAPAAVLAAAGVGPDRLPGALHAAEHAAIGLLPIVASCDRWDLGGLSTAMHPDTGQPTVFVHDAAPGGAGFAEHGFLTPARWLGATRELLAQCPCTAGCPSCVQSPKCGNGNSPLDKAGALSLLTLLVSALPEEPGSGS